VGACDGESAVPVTGDRVGTDELDGGDVKAAGVDATLAGVRAAAGVDATAGRAVSAVGTAGRLSACASRCVALTIRMVGKALSVV
jgi:hypothetical protein